MRERHTILVLSGDSCRVRGHRFDAAEERKHCEDEEQAPHRRHGRAHRLARSVRRQQLRRAPELEGADGDDEHGRYPAWEGGGGEGVLGGRRICVRVCVCVNVCAVRERVGEVEVWLARKDHWSMPPAALPRRVAHWRYDDPNEPSTIPTPPDSS